MKQKSFPYRQIIHPFVCKQLDTGYLHGDRGLELQTKVRNHGEGLPLLCHMGVDPKVSRHEIGLLSHKS